MISDPKPQGLTTASNFVTGTSNAITFSVNIFNDRTGGSGDDVFAAINPKSNFKIKLQLSDVDMSSATDTLSMPMVDATVAVATLRGGVAAAATLAVTGATANVLLPDAKCAAAKFLCAFLYRGVDPLFIDLSAYNNPSNFQPNTTCFGITALKECHIGELLTVNTVRPDYLSNRQTENVFS